MKQSYFSIAFADYNVYHSLISGTVCRIFWGIGNSSILHLCRVYFVCFCMCLAANSRLSLETLKNTMHMHTFVHLFRFNCTVSILATFVHRA